MMSNFGSNLVGKVGTFFGISKQDSKNIEQWKERAEKKIQNKEFGLGLKRIFQSKKVRSDSKFVSDARQVLSQIEAVQKLEDQDSSYTQTDNTAGSSEHTGNLKHGEQPHTSTTTQRFKEAKAASKTVTINVDTETEVEPSSRAKSAVSEPFRVVFNKVYTDDDDYDDSQEFKGASEAISVNLGQSSESITGPSSDYRHESVKITSKSSYPKIIFFNEVLQTKPSKEEENKQGLSDSDATHKVQPKKNIGIDKLQTTKKGTSDESNTPLSQKINKENNEKSTKRKVETKAPVQKLKGTEAKTKALQSSKMISHDNSNSKQKQEELEEPVKHLSESTPPESCDKSEKEISQDECDRQENSDVKEEILTAQDFVYGKEALAHYSFYMQIQRKVEKQKLVMEFAEKMSEYDWKIKAVDDLTEMARDYYLNPKSTNASNWKDLKRKVRRSSSHKLGRTEVRRKLDTLPDYRPYFTWFIILAQIITVAVTCGLGGITFIGLEPRLTLERDIKTFMGMETIHKWTAPNIWLGPSNKYLISIGAFYAPCMRKDMEVLLMYARANFTHHSPLGCCEIKSRNIAGTTTEAECKQLSEGIAVWKSDTTCHNRPTGQSGVRHELRPCCLGLKGQCRLLSHKHCTFLDGSFHQFGAEHCSQVNCLQGVCGLGHLSSSAEQPWFPDAPYQWWRLPLSLIYHHGIIHVALVVIAQWILFTQIERTAGWLRMVIIYLLSGMGTLLTSAVYSPYQSHVGSVGSVCGMVGVVLVELVQFWSLVQSPKKELAKISTAIIIFLFCGTLPYLDFFGLFGGFIIGALTGVIVLPYVTFGKWQTRARIFLIGVGVPLVIVIFSVLLHLFLRVQSALAMQGSHIPNCIPPSSLGDSQINRHVLNSGDNKSQISHIK